MATSHIPLSIQVVKTAARILEREASKIARAEHPDHRAAVEKISRLIRVAAELKTLGL